MAPNLDKVNMPAPIMDTKNLAENQHILEAHPMKGGHDLDSYSENSSYQRGVIAAAKDVIVHAVNENLDLETLSFEQSKPFHLADYGCSTGPNTFLAMQNIIGAVENKFKPSQEVPEFQVFFNDHVNNDFNVLFSSLSPTRNYFASGVPGSFYTRVFPKSSVHFAHCSYALHWLSKVPKEIQDKNSPAYSKGRIHYTGSEKEEVEAYLGQFKKDMEKFLKCRAEEIVAGGLMVILIPGVPGGEVSFTQTGAGMLHFLLGCSLMELANMGLISEDSVDSFNLPQYHPSTEELKIVIQTNNSFTIEQVGTLNHPMKNLSFDPPMASKQVRAIMEGIIAAHFGDKILDPLFEIFSRRLQENYHVFDKEIRKDADLFLVLKRKSF